MVQLEFLGIDPPTNVTVVAVYETVPPHWGVAGTPETVTLAGRVSVNVTSVRSPFTSVRLFLRVMVTVDVPPVGMDAGLKAFVPVSQRVIARLAVTAEGLVIPWSVVREFGGMVFVKVAAGASGKVVTATVMVQVP